MKNLSVALAAVVLFGAITLLPPVQSTASPAVPAPAAAPDMSTVVFTRFWTLMCVGCNLKSVLG